MSDPTDPTAFHALGRIVRVASRELDTFPAPPNMTRVSCISDEVTALCPVTGQPDQYTVAIEYAPDTRCVESKALKLYFWSFREAGIFCEAFASQICTDLLAALDPFWCRVTVTQKPRGGISIVAVASEQREQRDASHRTSTTGDTNPCPDDSQPTTPRRRRRSSHNSSKRA